MKKKDKQTTQEFFPRAKVVKDKDALIFSKAPINKNEAFKERKQKVISEQEETFTRERAAKTNPKAAEAGKSFLHKLYRDDDQFNELKVHGGLDEDDEELLEARADDGGMVKRKTKTIDKMNSRKEKTSYSQKIDKAGSRVSKLSLRKGALALFAICEIGEDHLIVNHTRNSKGYIQLSGTGLIATQFSIGQLVVASVNAEIGGANTGTVFNFGSGNAGKNKKTQLTLDAGQINKLLDAKTVTKCMVLQGMIESKEAKGFILNLGFKDKTKGFLKYSDLASEKVLKKGHLVQVIVKSVIQASKVVKCELLNENNCTECVQQSSINQDVNQQMIDKTEATITASQVKPGFLVSGKISKVYENGVDVQFLGGLEATCFIDHLKDELSSYKVGQKCQARIMSVDTIAKKITVSLKDSIVEWESHKVIDPELMALKVGQVLKNAKVTKLIYGGSYIVEFPESGIAINGFLHKSQIAEHRKQEDDDSDEQQAPEKELTVGQTLETVKVKEINYLDRTPIVSIRPSLLGTDALNYSTIEAGQYFSAMIEKVNMEKKFITLAVNSYVKGNLHIEHMADNNIKQMPPKFLEVGKEIKVRVFNVKASKRSIEFTKKDSLMKGDVPIFQSYKDVKKGTKVMGVVVGQTEFGYVVRSFGNLKGLLTLEDVKDKMGKEFDQSAFKIGSLVKTYVLFKKKDKGVALTMSKKKAKADVTETNQNDESLSKTIDSAYLPTDEQLEEIMEQDKYASMLKSSKDKSNVGKIQQFRILEDDESRPYIIMKCTDTEKKSKAFFGLLPRCLISSNQSVNVNLSASDFNCKGIVLEVYKQSLPIISIQPELIELNESILKSSQNQETLPSGTTYIGVINGIVGKAGLVSVRFLDGIKHSIKVKDLNTTEDYKKLYYPGKVIRVAVNKLGRLCTKAKVIEACLAAKSISSDVDKIAQIKGFSDQYQESIKDLGIRPGQEVEAEVQLVKEYGVIVKINDQTEVQTGFIINDQKSQAKYSQGQVIKCVVIDIDPSKRIADLSEKLINVKTKSEKIKVGSTHKALVELNKDSYLIASIKNSRKSIGICMMNNFNMDNVNLDNSNIGDEIEVKVVANNEQGLQLIPSVKPEDSKKKSSIQFELKEGIRFSGQIKNIKNQCMYIAVPSKGSKTAVIGRLQMVECQSVKEFQQYTVGDKIEAKILKVTQDEAKGRTWVELTRNKTHMSKSQGLDSSLLDKTVMGIEDLKKGQRYDGIIVSSTWDSEEPINLKISKPLSVQISAFVKGYVSFNQISEIDDVAQFGLSGKKYKIGQKVSVEHISADKFSLLDQPSKDKSSYKKGELLIARFVKIVKGRGVTVQISENLFAFVEISEITDDITGNVFKHLQKKMIFAARVIDHDKNGKIQLSTRESVVDEESWKSIKPEATTIKFQEANQVQKQRGNMRNAILKFGANVALQQGDLAIGYIVNIGKAGCFVQIGHNCTVRAGLNELSDKKNFNFNEEMPVGRIVIGRVYKIDIQPNGEKRFNFSTRKSLVVFGAQQVYRNKLSVDDEVESIIMALAEGKAFSQIKGSYIQIKVKGYTDNDKLAVGDHVFSSLKKVTKEKISSEFIGRTGSSGQKAEMTDDESKALGIFESVKTEAEKDIESIKELNAEVDKSGPQDFDTTLIDQKNFLDKEEQIAQQIIDLNQLEKEEDQEMAGSGDEDSDAEDMKRLIKYSESGESGEEDQDMEDEDDIDQDSDEEEGEQEGEEGSASESEEVQTKSKKRTLKDRMKEEQEIRDKEKRMRSGTDKPKDIDDFERLLVANQDQSYLWIQYMAFMLDNVGIDAARKISERSVSSVSVSNDEDKLNIWTAFMNLESNFGSQESLEECTRRALEVNDRKKVYLTLIDIYKGSMKFEFTEVIYKQLTKKYSNNLEVWSGYLEFLIEMQAKKQDESQKFVVENLKLSDAKQILQRALQALSKDQHVNMISKYGMLEFKHGNPENGRTMFEGIVSNYPKRMDIWSIYMDMEMKYGQSNVTQARHLFERCLSNEYIMKKPKKMKLVFQKYMEYENKQGNKNNLDKLRERVEQYLTKFYDKQNESGDGSKNSESE